MKQFLRVAFATLLLFLAAPYSKAQSPVVDSINFKGATNIFVSRHGLGNPASSCTGIYEYIQDDDTTGQPIWICQAGTMIHTSGGSTTPAPITYAINFSNNGHTSLQGNANFLFDPTINTFESNANTRLASMESTPRTIYDPWNTNYCNSGKTVCGLAAAITAGGSAPTQVIQAAIDNAECNVLMGVTTGPMRIALPNARLFVSQLLLWSNQELSGDSLRTQPYMFHTVDTASMIKGHGNTDTITCSNGTTYTPGVVAGGVLIQNIGIAGQNSAGSGTQDIGIEENGQAWFVYDISGIGNAFSSQAILDDGFENFNYRLGYPGSQLAGCASYINGKLTGICGAVQQGSTDGELDYVYATDAQGIVSGHPAGPCYPNCAAILIGGANVEASHLFAQLSDIDIIVNGANLRGTLWRADATSREMIHFGTNGSGAVLSDIQGISPCLDATLATAYAAGTATGCYGLVNDGQVNQISSMEMGGNGFFGTSYMQAQIFDGVSGGSVAPNTYSMIANAGNVANTTANNWLINCVCDGQNGSPRLVLPSMAPLGVGNTNTANVNGVNEIALTSTTPLTTLNGGIPGQSITIYAGLSGFSPQTGASIAPGGNIQLCPGLTAEPVNSVNGIVLTRAGLATSTLWGMNCNDPQANFVHLNGLTNGPATNPSIVDAYGNAQLRQIPAIDITSGLQLHGPSAPSGQYCFEEEAVYADGSHNVSPLACTNVDLTAQTPGIVFGILSTQAVTYNLWLVSNTTGSAVAAGKIAAPTIGGPTGILWDGPTTVAAGGNGAASPLAGENTTGLYLATWGVVNNTTANSQPTCTANRRGEQWMVDGGGTGPDTFQICVKTTGSTYAWVTH
jgi:hypothetical protein